MIKVLIQNKYDTFFALLMPSLLLAMTVTNNIFFLYFILALSLFYILKPIVIFPVYFIASLSTAYFAIGEGVSAGRYLSLIMIFSLGINIIMKGINNRKSVNINFIWILFVLYCFFSAVLSITASLTPFLLLIQGLLVLFLLPKIKGVDVEYFCSLLFFACIIGLIGVYIQFISVGYEQLLYERYRGLEGETNSNRIAMMVMQLALVIISPFVAYDQNKIIRLISILGFILAIVVIVLTGSRTSLLATLSAFIVIFLRISGQKFKKYFFSIFLVVFICILIVQQFSQIDSLVLDRFSLESLESSGGSDRVPAIKIFISYIFPEYPLFGVGLGGVNFNAVASRYGMNHPCHNIFFDSLAQLGLVGVFIFILLVFRVFYKTWIVLHNVQYQFPFIIALLLFLGAAVNGIGETVYLEKWFWNSLALCLLFITNKK